MLFSSDQISMKSLSLVAIFSAPFVIAMPAIRTLSVLTGLPVVNKSAIISLDFSAAFSQTLVE